MSTLSILTVCSGNICRSPLAEALLRAELAAIEGVKVSSAGVVAADSAVVTPQTARIGERLGLDLSSHRSRYLTESLVDRSDLLIAMSRQHRRAIVELVPRKVSTTFTLREFARIADGIADEELARAVAGLDAPPDRVKAVVRLVSAHRGGTDPLSDPSDDDIIDPYRRSDEVYEQSAAQLVPAVMSVARALSFARAS